jgi:hypothetical protein
VRIGGALNVCNITLPGGFAGLIFDFFAGGAVIPALQQTETWRFFGLAGALSSPKCPVGSYTL